jgi:hypothetical protein
MEQVWVKESYIYEWTRKERIVIIRLKAWIWKLRGIIREADRGVGPLCLWEQDSKHILLKCPQPKKCREYK